MPLQLRLLALSSALLLASVATAASQDRPFRSRAETFRIKRPPYSYFRYRVPSRTERMLPRIRLQQEDVRLRALERSRERIEQARVRRFDLQDRAWRRQLEVRERSMTRLRERMDRLRWTRPFALHRRLRTI